MAALEFEPLSTKPMLSESTEHPSERVRCSFSMSHFGIHLPVGIVLLAATCDKQRVLR